MNAQKCDWCNGTGFKGTLQRGECDGDDGLASVNQQVDSALAAASARIAELEDVLRDLAFYCGAGGYNAADPIGPERFRQKIRWGIDNAVASAIGDAVSRVKGTVAFRVMRSDFCGQVVDAIRAAQQFRQTPGGATK